MTEDQLAAIVGLPELKAAMRQLDDATAALQEAASLVAQAASAVSAPALDEARINSALAFLRETNKPVKDVLNAWPYSDLRQRLVDEMRAAGYYVGDV